MTDKLPTSDELNRASYALCRMGVTAEESALNLGRFMSTMGDDVKTDNDRETAAVEAVKIRAKRLGAGKHATAWGCLGARNAIKAGESGHRAIEIGTSRAMDMLEAME